MPNNWRRLSLLAIVFFSLRTLRQLLSLYPALIGAAFTARQLALSVSEVAFYLACTIIVVVLGAALSWLNFQYVREASRIRIRSGVFSKEQLELSFDLIQSVSIKEPFYFRPFDLVILSMDSAGSSQNEVNIAALARSDAQSIKAAIQSYSRETTANLATREPLGDQREGAQRADEKEAGGAELLLERGLRDLIIYGFTRNRAWIILAFLWPLFDRAEASIYRVTKNLGFDLSAWVEAQSPLALASVVALLALIFILLTGLLSVASSVLALANYQLSYLRGSYQRNSGLLNKYEIKLKRSRVQSIVYEKHWLDMIFHRSVMMLEPFSSNAGLQSMDGFMQKVLVPSISNDEFDKLAGHVFPGLVLNLQAFTGISRLFILRKFFKYAIIVCFVACGSWVYTADLSSAAVILLLPLILPLIILRWRRYGWQCVGDYLVLRTGFLGVTYTCFPRYKIQQARFLQSLILKRRGLASVTLVLASRAVTLPLIKDVDARKIIDQSIADAELCGRSWM